MKKAIFGLCFFTLLSLSAQPTIQIGEDKIEYGPNIETSWHTSVTGFVEKNNGTILISYGDLGFLFQIEDGLWYSFFIYVQPSYFTERLLYVSDENVTWALQEHTFVGETSSRLVKLYSEDMNHVGFNNIPSAKNSPMAIDLTGKLWLANVKHIISIEEENGELEIIEHRFDSLTGPSLVNDIDIATDGSIWYSAGLSILRFDGNQHEIMYEADDLIKKIELGNNGEVYAIIGEYDDYGWNYENEVYKFTLEMPQGESLNIGCLETPWFGTHDIVIGEYGELWLSGVYEKVFPGSIGTKYRPIVAAYYEEEWICTASNMPFKWDNFFEQKAYLYKRNNGSIALPYEGLVENNNSQNPMFIYDLSLDGVVATESLVTDKLKMSVFPNPSSLSTNVSYTLEAQSDVQITIYDVSGKQRYQKMISNSQQGEHSTEIGLDQLSSGIYIIEMLTNQGKVFEKVVIQ